VREKGERERAREKEEREKMESESGTLSLVANQITSLCLKPTP